MTKRITALVLAVILPITLVFTSCGKAKGPQLNAQEYWNQSDKLVRSFVSNTTDASMLFMEWRFGNAEDIAKLKELIENREAALDGLETLNPPEKYKDMQKKLVKSIKYERDWDKAALKYETAKTDKDLDKIGAKFQKIVGDTNKEYLPSVYVEITRSLNKEPNIVKPSTS